MVNVRGGGSTRGTTGGSGRLKSSKLAVLDHLWKPWDSPTGLREKGGVANEEFVVSVKESALGEVDVMTSKLELAPRSFPLTPLSVEMFW